MGAPQSQPLASRDAGRGADERVRGKEWPRLAGEDDDDTRPPDHPPERGSISVPVATGRKGMHGAGKGGTPLANVDSSAATRRADPSPSPSASAPALVQVLTCQHNSHGNFASPLHALLGGFRHAVSWVV